MTHCGGKEIRHFLARIAAADQGLQIYQPGDYKGSLRIRLRTWKEMSGSQETVHLPYTIYGLTQRTREISDALNVTPNLKTLVLYHPQLSDHLIDRLSKNPSLEVLRIVPSRNPDVWTPPDYGYRLRGIEAGLIKESPRLQKIFRFEYPDDPALREETPYPDPEEILPTFSESFVAMQSTPDDVKKVIWSNIIYFALLLDPSEVEKLDSRHNEDLNDASKISPDSFNKSWRGGFLHVSKPFRKLAFEHFYRYSLLCEPNISRLCSHIQEEPIVATYLHYITVHPLFKDNQDLVFDEIIPRATRLVRLSAPADTPFGPESNKHNFTIRCSSLDFSTLEAIAATAGPTLEVLSGFVLVRSSSPRPAAPLLAFTAIRHLTWETTTRLRFKPKDIPRDALQTLESLTYASSNDTFLTLLECMNLPALQTLVIPKSQKQEGVYSFLRKHGQKITTLKAEDTSGFFALCPSLSVVYISGPPDFHEPLKGLTKIILSCQDSRIKYKLEALGTADFGALYPALREIQVYAVEWPTNE
ncbi:hypothetical protein H0H81_010345 [Sphagnurus paluster]|uniref:Uncharacterized protein n=1 Tax=Sphagnurus paluster TaxID=117069 RepID=A0A9P7GKJ7_9AGAR|nr:hypothetical protein H0H81_010345 [Sphagnurus paluster]